jgi:UDP-glucose:(heptosyl)LPS alpha-1,3-glucosyltransferase
MRLGLIRQDYRPEGAVERITERALEALLERNVAISLYTRSWPQTRLQLVEPVIVDPFHVGNVWRDRGFARAACREVRRSPPTLVESHERLLCCDVYRAGDGVHAVWLEERLKRATVAGRVCAMLSAHDRYLAAAERRLYASPWLRAVVCGSKMVSEEIGSRFRVPASKLHVIYNPVDSELFHPGLRAERARTLDALALLAPPAHLVAMGDDANGARFLRQAQARGVGSRVTLVGGDADPRPYYGAADAFVCPAIYDPSPRSTLEAMACALPVIASPKSGAAELLREHRGGLVCPSGDVGALAAHMRTLQDPSTRAVLAANARRAVQPLSPPAITLQQVLLYRDLLATRAPGSTAFPLLDTPAEPRDPARRSPPGRQ